jgi:hypothetical protein
MEEDKDGWFFEAVSYLVQGDIETVAKVQSYIFDLASLGVEKLADVSSLRSCELNPRLG